MLRGVGVEFDRGEFVALLGDSGCGKSTFLNILGGLDSDYGGTVEVGGTDLARFSEREMDDYRKKEVGIVFQSYNLINHMTVEENVAVALTLTGVARTERKARTERLIARVKMSEHAKKYPYQLSGGQKQRVAIARSLANDPAVILADEPTGNLDKTAAGEVLEILEEIARKGKIVICVTHSERVADACTRVVRLDDGKIVSDKQNKSYEAAEDSVAAPARPGSVKSGELFRLAYGNIKQSKKRSVLVVTALAVGIAAFVLVFSIGRGLRGYVSEEVASAMNRLQIDVMKDANGVGTFDENDINIISNFKGTGAAIPSASVILAARYKAEDDGDWAALLTLGAVFEGFSANLKRGRLPAGAGDILVSSAMAARLNGGDARSAVAVIGKEIRVNAESGGAENVFTVCGVIDDGSNFDAAYVTGAALDALYAGGAAPVNKLYVLAKDTTWIKALTDDLNLIGYYAFRQDAVVEELLSYVDMGTATLAVVAAVALLVSAIMTFIVTYISVTERTREIGILRSIGARRRDIRRIFTFESLITGVAAGCAGGFSAWLIGFFTNLITRASVISLNPLYALSGVLIGAGLCTVSGVSPAERAADSDPAEALRA